MTCNVNDNDNDKEKTGSFCASSFLFVFVLVRSFVLEGELVTYCQGEYAVLAVLDAGKAFLVQLGETNLITCIDNDRHFELVRNTYRNREIKLLVLVWRQHRLLHVQRIWRKP